MPTAPRSRRHQLLNRPDVEPHLQALRHSFQRGRLTLYLGAGVSRDSGLPNWSTLIASLYYAAVDADWAPKWNAYPNYLYALGEWLLKHSGESPEVIAGKIESYYGSNTGFAQQLKEILYMPWREGTQVRLPSADRLRGSNVLLAAVAKLCEETQGKRGVHAVVTTNYDSLLEQALVRGSAERKFKPIWKSSEKLAARKKGIFHVHGYIPATGSGSPYEEIVLTEAQYHGAASDPYSWSNLTLIQCFSASTGLMIGMSMTDRNLRRLLSALSRTQLRENQYALLKEPEVPSLTECDVADVNSRATAYLMRFAGSGVKKTGKLPKAMQEILAELVRQEKAMTVKSLASLGVTPLWVREYAEIPLIVEAVAAT